MQSVKPLRKFYEAALEETNKRQKIADKEGIVKLIDSDIRYKVKDRLQKTCQTKRKSGVKK